MNRKAALRTLATAAALPWMAPDELAALFDARRSLARPEVGLSSRAPGVRVALTDHELEIVGLVADLILPRSDTPSATDLGVPAFVDLIVGEWMDDEDASEFRAGLASLDDTARARSGAPFAAAPEENRLAIVRTLDEGLPEVGSDAPVPDGFYPTLKRLVVTGYFTTAQGASQTGYRITPGMYAGCVAPGDRP